jgi:hypothetical protein
MTAEEEKQDDSILQKEIKSCNDHFGYALREVNRILFIKYIVSKKEMLHRLGEKDCKLAINTG